LLAWIAILTSVVAVSLAAFLAWIIPKRAQEKVEALLEEAGLL
jgi:hypothetical protein